MSRFVKQVLWRAWFPLALVVIWQLVLRQSTNPFFPPPSKILSSTRDVINVDWIKTSFASSMLTLSSGYLIGCALGISLGAMLGISEKLQLIFLPIINFIRSIPSVAKVPVVMALMGIGTATRISAISIAVLFPVLLSTLRAVAATESTYLDAARIMGYGRIRELILVRLPAATGEILAGLHAAVQVAILVMVVSEMLGSGIGIGAFIIHSQATFMIADMWVGILILGVLGITLNVLFQMTESRIAPWYFDSKIPS